MIGVVGLGNILMGDDGLGVEVVNILKRDFVFSPKIEIIDGGVGSFSLPFHRFDKLIIIDAIRDNSKSPGDLVSFSKKDILCGRIESKFSSHEISLDEIFFLLELREELPKEIFLFGIVPYKIEEFCLDLSFLVKKNIPNLIDNVLNKLKDWKISIKAKAKEVKNLPWNSNEGFRNK